MHGKITKSQIEKMREGDRLCGEGIEIRKSKKGLIFYAATQVNGHRLRAKLGSDKEGMNLTKARQQIIKLVAEHSSKNMKISKMPNITFKEASEKYLFTLTETGGKNLKQKKQQINMHLNPHFEKSKVKELTKIDVDRYVKQRRDASAAISTINRELATLRHLLNQIAEWGIVDTDHIKIKNISGENRRTNTFTDEQVKSMLSYAKLDADPYTYFFILIGFQTSMRHAEILKIKFEDFDYQNKGLLVPEAKAGQRSVPVHQSLLDVIAEEKSRRGVQTGYLFASQSKTGHRTYMKKQFQRVLAAAGLKGTGLTPHSMRHTAISKIMRTQISISDAMVISGHKSTQMLLHYTHHNSHGVLLGVSALADLTNEKNTVSESQP